MNMPVAPVDSLIKLAQYRLVRKIGQGGMSVVYEAFDERLKRSIALKLLHPFLASSQEYRARFLREAEAVARLTHQNIVQIYDIRQEEQLYIITELITGGTLSEKSRQINFSEFPELSAMIIAQVASALEHAHQKGIIHRDIKPENIMLTSDGQIKLMDFGIASISQEESLTQAGVLLGSLAHVAPEIIKGEKASVRSDIFSLSTVFYWLACGELPFKGDSPHALLKAIVDEPAEKIQILSPYISDRLAQIIEKGMHKDPDQRFAEASLLIEAIEQALLEMGLPPDFNKLRAVLSKPEVELAAYKLFVLKSIASQAAHYQKAGNHSLAIALQCRIDAINPKLVPPPKDNNSLRIIMLALSLIAVFAYFFMTKLSGQKQETEPSAPKPLESEITAAVQELSMAEKIAPVDNQALVPEVLDPEIKPVLEQELSISIWPFANILLNNKEVAKDAKHMKIKLEPGLHRLKFTHAYAASVEKIVNIKSSTKPQKLEIIMNKSKPAYLIVDCSVDADVAVNGLFKGSSSKSIMRPIVVPLPDKTHALDVEVIVQRDGFEPVMLSLKLIAGQRQKIHVNLIPIAKSEKGESP